MGASKTAKLAAALRWLAPSAVAASGGAAAAGIWEGIGLPGPLALGAAAGFVAFVAWPFLLAASALSRGLWAGWRPRELGLVGEDGRAPRLAGWVATLWLSAFALAWAMFQGTWLLAGATAFKPVSIAFAEPALAVSVALVLVLVSRPVSRGLTWVMVRIDARWRVTPRRIAVAVVAATLVAGYLVWRLLMKKRFGTLDLSLAHAPLVGVAAALAVHAGWHRLGRFRRAFGAGLGALAAIALALALYAWRAEPNLTLAIWGERPLAGFAIDHLLDLDAIRARLSLAEFRPVDRPGSAHPDLILVTIDTVRADRTPPYGGSAEMPLLRELGVRGAVFEWAFAPSNVTRRSIPSMMTGLAPNRVRGRVVGWALRMDPRHVLVAERLLAGGYETAGFVCCYGFWGKDFRTGFQRGLQHLVIEPNGMKLARQARAWIDERDRRGVRRPLFLWMHLLEPHNWQSGTGVPTNDEERRRFYDRSLTAADTMLVELLSAFKERRPEDAPIVVVTADHGEALGEHGQPYHSTDLYNSQIRVPLVIAGPGIKAGRVTETVSLTDLTPTLLELAGFVPPKGPSMDGRSLADLATGRRQSALDGGVAFAAMIKDRSNPGGITAVVRGGWKLIETSNGLELYNLQSDPDERSNVASTKPLLLEELRHLLRRYVDAAEVSPFQ